MASWLASTLGYTDQADFKRAEKDAESAKTRADNLRRERDRADKERDEIRRDRDRADREREDIRRQRDRADREKEDIRRERDRADRERDNAFAKASQADRQAAAATEELRRYHQKEDDKKQEEKRRLESDDKIKEHVHRRRPVLLDRFKGQRIILIGKPGSGKSSVINSFSYVVSLCYNEYAEYEESSETSGGKLLGTKTIMLDELGPDDPSMYRCLSVEERSKAPSFIDVCGIQNETDVRTFIRALAEGKVEPGSRLLPLLRQTSDELTESLGERKNELASWNMIFLVSAAEEFPSTLASEVYKALRSLEEKHLSIRVYTFITKVDTIEPDQEKETVERITTDAMESLNVDRLRVFQIVNFLPSDCDDSYEMQPVLKKQKMLIDAFIKILAPVAKPKWAQEK